MSADPRTDRPSTGTVRFTDDSRSSERLRSEETASKRLDAHSKVQVASLSGKQKKPQKAPDANLPPSWREVEPEITPDPPHDRPPEVKASDRNVDILSARRRATLKHNTIPRQLTSAPQDQATPGAASGQQDAPTAKPSDRLVERGKASAALSARPSVLTTAGAGLLRHGGGLVDKLVYRTSQANDLFSRAAQGDPAAQGSAAAVRSTVQAATTASAAMRASAWTAQAWLSSPFRLVRGAGSLISLVQAQGILGAAGSILTGGAKFLLKSIGGAISGLLLGILLPLLAVLLIIGVLTGIFGAGTDMSFGTGLGGAEALETLYSYCTLKDAELNAELQQLLQSEGYFSVTLSVNGSELSDAEAYAVSTDIDRLLVYLQAANADGTHSIDDLKAQIDGIYADLYTVETEEHRSSTSAIAEAAVLVAEEHTPARKGFQLPENNGSELYRQVHDLTQNNRLYQSCDRVACAIIRWSGADDNFPTGLYGMVYHYLRDDGQGAGRNKWMKLPDGWTRDDLQPGDVLIWKGHQHVFIYVGHELIEERFPNLTDPNICVVEGSYNTSFAACCNKWDDRMDNNSFVYRNIQPEANPKYVNGITGVTPGKNALDIRVTAASLSGWIEAHAEGSTQDYMELMTAFGTYAGYATADNPFGSGQHWSVPDRYGSYADGGDVFTRNSISVWTVSGQDVYSPINGLVTWHGDTVTIRDAWATEQVETVTISGLSPAVTVGAVSAGDLVGTATGTTVTISYQIDGGYVNPAFYLQNTAGSSDGEALVAAALSQTGQQGGEPYWSWYGFNSRVSWCACFVSWCADQCDLISAGTIPKYAACSDGAAWFQRNGQWAGRGYTPSAGDIIFFINAGDTVSHHTGIVVSCDGSTVQTVEGNSGDAVRLHSYPVNDAYILGYGLPAYP